MSAMPVCAPASDSPHHTPRTTSPAQRADLADTDGDPYTGEQPLTTAGVRAGGWCPTRKRWCVTGRMAAADSSGRLLTLAEVSAVGSTARRTAC